ncbi:MAG: coenzyme F420-0:L-glutamate ligase [Bacillota bacterium]|nr:coenzyme F420-0:L-glutamate ligase [Bacillota bacterium]
MFKLPDYIGPLAFGLKMGVILPGTDLVKEITAAVEKVAFDGLLSDQDVICVTESVVARSQGNYVTVDEVVREIKEKLQIADDAVIGVLFPMASRNRFSLILQGIARAVPRGEVVVQFSYPADEVGNRLVSPAALEAMEIKNGLIRYEELEPRYCLHPVTKVNYPALYHEIITREKAKATIIFSNNPLQILAYEPDGVIAADIHNRIKTCRELREVGANCITLQDLCNEGEKSSEWGLMGSNMSANCRLKLAPRNATEFARKLQEEIKKATGFRVEVLVYGDGAYKDPSTGIYELADPLPVFGMTEGFSGRCRGGVKYKYIADLCHAEGKSAEEIEKLLAAYNKQPPARDDLITEGTTPRRIEDIIASLADLVSGSSDAGTPVVIVKGIL